MTNSPTSLHPSDGPSGPLEERLSLSLVHPVQFASLWRDSGHSPERELAAAMIETAVTDLRGNRYAGHREQQRFYLRAYEWVMSDDREWPFSFVNLCEYLTVTPDAVREAALRDLPETRRATAA